MIENNAFPNQQENGIDILRKYLEENPNYIYKIIIEGKEYSIPLKEIIDYITMEDDDLYYQSNYMYTPENNMSLTHFKYAILSFFREKFRELDINFGDKIEGRLDSIANDESVRLVNQYYKTNNPNFTKISVSDELREAIFKDMPDYGDYKILEAIYIYIKMCKLLTYDDEFFAVNQQGESAQMHEDITHISTITPQNNKVVCYEFASIYEALLSEIGIPSEIVKATDEIDTYGKSHTAVRFKSGDFLITADSTTGILSGDLFAAKLNLPLSGLTCRSQSSYYFYKTVEGVYKEIQANESKSEVPPVSTEELLEEYSHSTESIKDVSISERINILISKTNSANLKGVDCLAYLLYLKKLLFKGELSKNINISIVRDDSQEHTTARAILMIKGIDEQNRERASYYSYEPSKPLEEISLSELQLMFDIGELGYIQEEGKNQIPGIKVR